MVKAFLAVSLYAVWTAAYTLWLMWDKRFYIAGRRQVVGVWVKTSLTRRWLRIRAMARLMRGRLLRYARNDVMEVWHVR